MATSVSRLPIDRLARSSLAILSSRCCHCHQYTIDMDSGVLTRGYAETGVCVETVDLAGLDDVSLAWE